jgi:hypothetical protein
MPSLKKLFGAQQLVLHFVSSPIALLGTVQKHT